MFIFYRKTVDKQRQEELKDDIKTDLTDGSDPGSIIDEDDDDDIDNEIYLPTSSSTKDISPTQSVRSLLMRPRSTPIRRATISAGSPTKHQPYINVSEVCKVFYLLSILHTHAAFLDTSKLEPERSSPKNSTMG